MTNPKKLSEQIAAKIINLPVWESEPKLTVIEAGRTNTNFKAEVDDKTYFVRYGDDLPHHFIYRENEKLAISVVEKADLAPKIIYAEDGFLITDFIKGRTLEIRDVENDNCLCDIARLLKDLHTLDFRGIKNDFDLHQIVKTYLEKLGDKISPKWRLEIDEIIRKLPSFKDNSLIHGDVLNENFIADGQRLWLIDWEYAGIGNPAIDLAMCASNFDLSETQIARLVEVHGLCSIENVQSLIPVLTAREALWTKVQIEQVGLIGDLETYSKLCDERLAAYFDV
jgi:thiamine kinase-like enzyme